MTLPVVVIPVFNQAHYTETCLAGLNAAGIPDGQIVVVDNASTDDTPACLAARPALQVIRNDANRGCGTAWNQGVRAFPTATWSIILNNDVLIPQGWLEGLLAFAEQEQVEVVSPAICGGEQDYDFPAHARRFMAAMAPAQRRGLALGCCFMVHRRVFERVGYFDDDRRLGGYEDDEFFRRTSQAGFRLAVTGRAFLHHFGSVTQKAIQASMNQPGASLGDREYYRRKYGLTWFKRHRTRFYRKIQTTIWRLSERSRYGYTLRSRRKNGTFIWL